jgi:hypothetical protein
VPRRVAPDSRDPSVTADGRAASGVTGVRSAARVNRRSALFSAAACTLLIRVAKQQPPEIIEETRS